VILDHNDASVLEICLLYGFVIVFPENGIKRTVADHLSYPKLNSTLQRNVVFVKEEVIRPRIVNQQILFDCKIGIVLGEMVVFPEDLADSPGEKIDMPEAGLLEQRDVVGLVNLDVIAFIQLDIAPAYPLPDRQRLQVFERLDLIDSCLLFFCDQRNPIAKNTFSQRNTQRQKFGFFFDRSG